LASFVVVTSRFRILGNENELLSLDPLKISVEAILEIFLLMSLSLMT